MKKNKHIVKLSYSTGLCVFLIAGLSGCDDSKCNDLIINGEPQNKIDECIKNKNNQVFIAPVSSGYFGSYSAVSLG